MTQKSVVVGMLREAGPKGVSVHDLIYRHGITRAAAIVHDLRTEDGMNIVTVDEGDGKLARYVLQGSHLERPRRPDLEEALPLPPAKPIEWSCGCIRAADGRSWVVRCDLHAGVSPYAKPSPEVNW